MFKFFSPVFLLASSAILSRVLGFSRDLIFARIFGVQNSNPIYSLDLYFVAFRAPDLIYSLLIAGIISSVFIPIYHKCAHEDAEKAEFFTAQIFNILLVALLFFSLLAFFASPYLMSLLLPEFSPEAREICVDLTRIMLLSPILLGISSFFQAYQNIHNKFLGMALAPIFYNLGIISMALLYGEKFGIYSLAFGVVLGAFLHFLIQLPLLKGLKFPFSLKKEIFARDSMHFLKMFFLQIVPRFLSLFCVQAGILFETFLAATLMVGSLTLYNLALNVESIPYGIVSVSVSLAVFSNLSLQSARGENALFKETFIKALNQILFWVLPMVFGIFVLRDALLEFFYLGGAFTAEDLSRASEILSIIIWLAIPQSILPLLIRAFFALNDTWRPLLIAFFGMMTHAVLSCSFILIFDLSVSSLAISAIISSVVQILIALFFLSRLSGTLFFDFKYLLRCSVGLILMLMCLLPISFLLENYLVLQISFGVLASVFVYLSSAVLFKFSPYRLNGK